MKTLFLIMTLIPMLCMGQMQHPSGKVVVERITSQALKNNSGGENPTRRVTVYLPPDYDKTSNRYPVIYYLHGFTWNDSMQIAIDHFDKLLDKAIQTGKIRPVIVVMPNQYTLYRGSFYTNSSLTGKWADFTAIDLVNYVDKHYRTISAKESRGIAGHSMGGHGALKIGMLFPNIFSSVYALSPAELGLAKEFGPGPAFKNIPQIKTREELIRDYDHFFENAFVATARAYSPNPKNPPFYVDLPFTYNGDSLIVNFDVLKKWHDNSPLNMVDNYVGNLKKLKAIKFDWGRNDFAPHIPYTCRLLSEKLENYQVNHYAEEYVGDHGDKLWTDDGRALNDMFPFFDYNLTFEDVQYTVKENKKKSK